MLRAAGKGTGLCRSAAAGSKHICRLSIRPAASDMD
jgi:hypothetical protein